MRFFVFYQKYKYYLLLFALIQHLFISIFLNDLTFYSRIVWPINMFILGLTSISLYIGQNRVKNYLKVFLSINVFTLPIILPFSYTPLFMEILSVIYILYFLSVFGEVIRFLIKPDYINIDIILASACGYLLLIEINTFLMFFLYYANNSPLSSIDNSHPPASIFIDLVYFSTIVKTSIGFGDISPQSHQAKLITAFFGIISQFYSVVLIGILISKFTSQKNLKS